MTATTAPGNPQSDEDAALRIGKACKAARERTGLKVNALARLSGVHRNTIRQIERGDCMPSMETFLRLTAAMHWDAWRVLRSALQ